jgi:hypothetical protein
LAAAGASFLSQLHPGFRHLKELRALLFALRVLRPRCAGVGELPVLGVTQHDALQRYRHRLVACAQDDLRVPVAAIIRAGSNPKRSYDQNLLAKNRSDDAVCSTMRNLEMDACHHQAVLTVDAWSDDVPVPCFAPRTGCGIIGADARANWRERPCLSESCIEFDNSNRPCLVQSRTPVSRPRR